MSNPSDPPFLADIRSRLDRYRDAVVCAVTSQTTADYNAARRLLDSAELFPDAAEGLSDLMRQFVADCRSYHVRADAATETAFAIQECTRQLRGLLTRFRTVHTPKGRASLVKLWCKSYGKGGHPEDAELHAFSLDLNRMGKGDSIEEAAGRITDLAVGHLSRIRSACLPRPVDIKTPEPTGGNAERPPPGEEVQRNVIKAIREAGRPLKRPDLAKKAGYKPGYLGHVLARMVKEGRIRTTPDGYALV